jgi:hypothetical protein
MHQRKWRNYEKGICEHADGDTFFGIIGVFQLCRVKLL